MSMVLIQTRKENVVYDLGYCHEHEQTFQPDGVVAFEESRRSGVVNAVNSGSQCLPGLVVAISAEFCTGMSMEGATSCFLF